MVFRGRPSKACFACRGRRIKCDRKKTGCGQCARMCIPCPGYPNPLEQDYRDQSELVMRKAEASYKKKMHREPRAKDHTSSPASSATSIESEKSSADLTIRVLYHNPTLHLDTVAVTEFMSSYIPQSPYDYLSTIFIHQRQEASLLVNVRAVSLAMTACKLKDPHILDLARRLYATALSNTNTALRDSNTATEDGTLVSVLLLGLFEALACQVSGTSTNWAMHTRGALTLLRLRGKDQFCSDLGRRLFEQISSILSFDAMVRKAHLSQDLLDLVSTAEKLRRGSPKMAFVNLIGEITESPCVLWDCNLPAVARVTRAQWLDQKIIQLTNELPPDFKYQELYQGTQIPLNSGWEVHGYVIHQYQHHHAARLWNAYRVLRMMLNGVVHRTIFETPSTAFPAPDGYKTALQCAVQNIGEAATDICASVPQLLNPAKYDKIGMEASHEARVSALLAALLVTKSEPLTPHTTRSYAGDRLKYLGRELKVPLAENAAILGIGLDALHSGYHMFYVY